MKYYEILTSYFQSKPLYLDGENFKKPNVRKLMEQPWQELETAKACEKLFEEIQNPESKAKREKLWDNVTDTLCNLDFIQAKAAAKLTYDLVNEINNALEVIPDNAAEIAKEKTRQARMEKYTQDLIACAKGEINIDELEIPESITPWTEEQINAEIERIKANSNRADRLKDFRNFLGMEMSYLQKFADQFTQISIQQFFKYGKDGPFEELTIQKKKDYNQFIFINHLNHQKWNPFPRIVRKITTDSFIRSLAILPEGNIGFEASWNGNVRIWNLMTGQKIIGQ